MIHLEALKDQLEAQMLDLQMMLNMLAGDGIANEEIPMFEQYTRELQVIKLMHAQLCTFLELTV